LPLIKEIPDEGLFPGVEFHNLPLTFFQSVYANSLTLNLRPSMSSQLSVRSVPTSHRYAIQAIGTCRYAQKIIRIFKTKSCYVKPVLRHVRKHTWAETRLFKSHKIIILSTAWYTRNDSLNEKLFRFSFIDSGLTAPWTHLVFVTKNQLILYMNTTCFCSEIRSNVRNTGRFLMFSVITNIYNK
jgi:hypothetical protein